VRDVLCQSRPDGYREFAAILLLHREFTADAVQTALEAAAERGCLQAGLVRQLILNQQAPAPPTPISLPERLAAVQIPLPDVAQYNALLEGVSA
jgi:hypothetical protein